MRTIQTNAVFNESFGYPCTCLRVCKSRALISPGKYTFFIAFTQFTAIYMYKSLLSDCVNVNFMGKNAFRLLYLVILCVGRVDSITFRFPTSSAKLFRSSLFDRAFPHFHFECGKRKILIFFIVEIIYLLIFVFDRQKENFCF